MRIAPIISGVATGLLAVLVLALLALALVACADITPCNVSPYATNGPCSVGRAHDD